MNTEADKDMTDFMLFLEVADQTIKNRNQGYAWECPLCGGKASGGKAGINGHIHAGCVDCGVQIMQ